MAKHSHFLAHKMSTSIDAPYNGDSKTIKELTSKWNSLCIEVDFTNHDIEVLRSVSNRIETAVMNEVSQEKKYNEKESIVVLKYTEKLVQGVFDDEYFHCIRFFKEHQQLEIVTNVHDKILEILQTLQLNEQVEHTYTKIKWIENILVSPYNVSTESQIREEQLTYSIIKSRQNSTTTRLYFYTCVTSVILSSILYQLGLFTIH
jgi:ABC-type oligopeptide transport system ATPase subunit